MTGLHVLLSADMRRGGARHLLGPPLDAPADNT
jgi:hypothetical protein